jgi:hypothetical protein
MSAAAQNQQIVDLELDEETYEFLQQEAARLNLSVEDVLRGITTGHVISELCRK